LQNAPLAWSLRCQGHFAAGRGFWLSPPRPFPFATMALGPRRNGNGGASWQERLILIYFDLFRFILIYFDLFSIYFDLF